MNAPFGTMRSDSAQITQLPQISLMRRYRGAFGMAIFLLALSAALLWTWLNRDSGVLSPKHGYGYWLGIAGTSMMGLVLLYPLRKRIKFMRGWGAIPIWFRWHMAFGLLGPVLVVMHSNFHVHSTNALVALSSMLVVAGSGIVGRYLYVHIHRGLYGAKLEARELLAEAKSVRELIGDQLAVSVNWSRQLEAFESNALVRPRTFLGAISKNIALGRLERQTRKALLREFNGHLNDEAERLGWPRAVRREKYRSGRRRIDRYFTAVRKAGALAVYERLFALWHVLHLPLIALLIVTALIHIVAVNMY